MSFALTTEQILLGTKTVTRRMGWSFLKAGDQIRPVKKCLGLRRGEKISVLRDPLTVTNVRRERLDVILSNPNECVLEGFQDMSPAEFVAMFCKTHKGCTPETIITRIEFSYIEQLKQGMGDE